MHLPDLIQLGKKDVFPEHKDALSVRMKLRMKNLNEK